jgi:predicted nucleic acid-binding protein
MAFVVDASLVAAWLLPDEKTPESEALLDRLSGEPVLAPDLIRHEIRSLILIAVKRGRVTEEFLPWAIGRFGRLAIANAGPGDDLGVLALAKAHNLSAYDAAYLALAIERALPLATLDTRLAQAARGETVEILGPLATP